MSETRPIAVLDTISLQRGKHGSPDEGMCVMEAVAYVAGEKFSDHPKCASEVISSFMRSWNDSLSSNAGRDRLLKPLIPLLLNSAGDDAIEMRRSYMALDWLVRTLLPTWLDLSDTLKADAARIRALPELVDPSGLALASPLVFEAQKNAAAAGDAAGAAAWAAARDAAWAAARDAAGDAIAPTVTQLQESAADLVKRMCAVGKEARP